MMLLRAAIRVLLGASGVVAWCLVVAVIARGTLDPQTAAAVSMVLGMLGGSAGMLYIFNALLELANKN